MKVLQSYNKTILTVFETRCIIIKARCK